MIAVAITALLIASSSGFASPNSNPGRSSGGMKKNAFQRGGDPAANLPHAMERAALWSGLKRAWGQKFHGAPLTISAYGESPTCSKIAFAARNNFYTFDVRTGRIDQIVTAKVVSPVNKISYESQTPDSGSFVFWSSGQPQLFVDSGG